ncbi:hypothetical protein ACQZV8_16465 [Magnetococcales bacterium HHB-1]
MFIWDTLSWRIKIGLVFGVMLAFLIGVVGQYAMTLQTAMENYDELQKRSVQYKSQAEVMLRYLAEARRAESQFQLTRDLAAVKRVEQSVEEIFQLTDREVNKPYSGAYRSHSIQPATTPEVWERHASLLLIDQGVQEYSDAFAAVVVAWKIKGLDHNQGLQGKFRRAAHTLEDYAKHFDVDQLRLLLLEIRRREKDLALRRNAQYLKMINDLLNRFQSIVKDSSFAVEEKKQLEQLSIRYKKEIQIYAQQVSVGAPIHEGKGPYREIAHKIEDILHQHTISDMAADILSIRRREKDYLLRGDQKYVTMVQREIKALSEKVSASSVLEVEKKQLQTLLKQYLNDFQRLVDQDQQIKAKVENMARAEKQITTNIQSQLNEAEAMMLAALDETHLETRKSAHLALTIGLLAIIIGGWMAYRLTQKLSRSMDAVMRLLGLFVQDDKRQDEIFKDRDEFTVLIKAIEEITMSYGAFIAFFKEKSEVCQHHAVGAYQTWQMARAQNLLSASEEIFFKGWRRQMDDHLKDLQQEIKVLCQQVHDPLEELEENNTSSDNQKDRSD